MSKAEIIAAIWMANHDMSHNDTLPDYVHQFDDLVRQVEALLESGDDN